MSAADSDGSKVKPVNSNIIENHFLNCNFLTARLVLSNLSPKILHEGLYTLTAINTGLEKQSALLAHTWGGRSWACSY